MTRTLQGLYWMVRACWAQVTGRWHYLREAPDWYVMELAAEPDPGPGYEDVSLLYGEARREMALRLTRMKRELEEMTSNTQDPGAQP